MDWRWSVMWGSLEKPSQWAEVYSLHGSREAGSRTADSWKNRSTPKVKSKGRDFNQWVCEPKWEQSLIPVSLWELTFLSFLMQAAGHHNIITPRDSVTNKNHSFFFISCRTLPYISQNYTIIYKLQQSKYITLTRSPWAPYHQGAFEQ